jgi:hypothetical protein
MSFEADPGQQAPDPGAVGDQGASVGQGVGKALDMFKSGSLSDAAMQNAASETQKLIDAAKSGGFKVDPNAIPDLLQSLGDMRMNLLTLQQGVFFLEQAPQLGNHPYGHTVAAHDQKTATASTGSVNAILQELSNVLSAATEALQRAAGVYDETEHQASGVIKSVRPDR